MLQFISSHPHSRASLLQLPPVQNSGDHFVTTATLLLLHPLRSYVAASHPPSSPVICYRLRSPPLLCFSILTAALLLLSSLLSLPPPSSHRLYCSPTTSQPPAPPLPICCCCSATSGAPLLSLSPFFFALSMSLLLGHSLPWFLSNLCTTTTGAKPISSILLLFRSRSMNLQFSSSLGPICSACNTIMVPPFSLSFEPTCNRSFRQANRRFPACRRRFPAPVTFRCKPLPSFSRSDTV